MAPNPPSLSDFYFLRFMYPDLYMYLMKKQNSMYPGTWIWWRKKIPCTGTWIWRKNKIPFTQVHESEKKSDNEGGGVRFFIWHISLIFNLKILSIQFCYVSRCHLKVFFIRISKQVLLFEICSFKNCKIEFEVVNI